jgi:adenosylhomocysteine nucleosidase
VVLVTGAGRAAAAEGMGLFFSRFRPLLLIGGGIAGGIGASVHIGELVIPEETVCYDEDATALKMPLGTLRRGRSAMTPVAGDPRFREAVERIAEHNGFVVHRGGIASGDTLLNRRTLAALPENRRRLIESAHAVDMESSVWSDFAVRGDVPLVLTRFISDHVTAGDRLGFVHACESIGEILVQVLRSCRMGPDGAIVIE